MTFVRLSSLLFLSSLCAFALAIPAQAQYASDTPVLQLAITPVAGSMIVYVSDFDLDVVYRQPRARPVPRTSPRLAAGIPSASSSTPARTPKTASLAPPSRTSQTPSASDTTLEETPADLANALVNTVSESLVRALVQAGYDARRLPAGTPLPKAGLRIRGVFGEADESNRARRLLVGGEPVGPKMLLFVAVNNLARPEQPLYELAFPPAPDSRHGPVITVTSYAPAARFELSRDPSDDELKKISANIAASLTALVNANRLSLAQ